MFKTLKLFFLILCIFINTNLSSAEQKIVYLNLDYIFQNSVPGKLILEGLDNKRKKNIEKFKLQENEFRQKEQDIINKKNILSKEEFETKVDKFKGEMKIYNEERKKIFLQFEENKKKELNEFLGKITPLIEDYVKKNSINIVLNEKNLFIASKKFDITNEIIEIINKTVK